MNKVLRDRDISSDQNTSALNQTGTHSLEGHKSHRQIPALDGVRAIACLSVIFISLSFIAGQQASGDPAYMTSMMYLAYLFILLHRLPILVIQALFSSFFSLAFCSFCPMLKRCYSKVPWPGLPSLLSSSHFPHSSRLFCCALLDSFILPSRIPAI